MAPNAIPLRASAGTDPICESTMHNLGSRIRHWLGRTPVQTFILCPLAVAGFEAVLRGRWPRIVPWGAPLLAWGYLQYRLVGRYRLPRAGGSAGMEVPPERIIMTGPYRYTRNPMYLGHMIFLAGLTVFFWSWFAVILLVLRAFWFHRRVLRDEARLEKLLASRIRLTAGV